MCTSNTTREEASEKEQEHMVVVFSEELLTNMGIFILL